MLIKGNFGELDGLCEQIQAALGRIEEEMDGWRRTSGATRHDWLDHAGDQFEDVSTAWTQMSQAQNEVMAVLQNAVRSTNEELQLALAAARATMAMKL
jgi:uncharacterized protein YukE